MNPVGPNEFLAFPLESLNGPNGERNFEMIRSELWLQRHSESGYSFERLLKNLSEPYEVNLEMLHMLAYVKRRAPAYAFDAFTCPYISAEFWLHSISNPVEELTNPLDISSQMEITSVHTNLNEETSFSLPPADSDVSERVVDLDTDETHRPIPGFRTILQCGKTICDDNQIQKSAIPSVLDNTPTAAVLIERMFNGTIQGFNKSDLTTTLSCPLNLFSLENQKLGSLVNIFSTASIISESPTKYSHSSSNELVPTHLNSKNHAIIKNRAENLEPPERSRMNTTTSHEEHQNNPLYTNTDAPFSSRFNVFYDPLGLETCEVKQGIPVSTSGAVVTCSVTHSPQSPLVNTPAHLSALNDTALLDLFDREIGSVPFKSTNFFNSPTALFEERLKAAQKRW